MPGWTAAATRKLQLMAICTACHQVMTVCCYLLPCFVSAGSLWLVKDIHTAAAASSTRDLLSPPRLTDACKRLLSYSSELVSQGQQRAWCCARCTSSIAVSAVSVLRSAAGAAACQHMARASTAAAVGLWPSLGFSSSSSWPSGRQMALLASSVAVAVGLGDF